MIEAERRYIERQQGRRWIPISGVQIGPVPIPDGQAYLDSVACYGDEQPADRN